MRRLRYVIEHSRIVGCESFVWLVQLLLICSWKIAVFRGPARIPLYPVQLVTEHIEVPRVKPLWTSHILTTTQADVCLSGTVALCVVHRSQSWLDIDSVSVSADITSFLHWLVVRVADYGNVCPKKNSTHRDTHSGGAHGLVHVESSGAVIMP